MLWGIVGLHKLLSIFEAVQVFGRMLRRMDDLWKEVQGFGDVFSASPWFRVALTGAWSSQGLPTLSIHFEVSGGWERRWETNIISIIGSLLKTLLTVIYIATPQM